MQLLKLKPATQLINGQQTPCYGIYCGDELLRTVSVFNYCGTLRMIRKANAVMEMQARLLIDRAKRMAAGAKAMRICTVSLDPVIAAQRQRLTKKTFIAANKAAKLGN